MINIKNGVNAHATELNELRIDIKADVESLQPRKDHHNGISINTARQLSPHLYPPHHDYFEGHLKDYEDDTPQPTHDQYSLSPTTFMVQHPIDMTGGRHPLLTPHQF